MVSSTRELFLHGAHAHLAIEKRDPSCSSWLCKEPEVLVGSRSSKNSSAGSDIQAFLSLLDASEKLKIMAEFKTKIKSVLVILLCIYDSLE
jgi:hypothetical protein